MTGPDEIPGVWSTADGTFIRFDVTVDITSVPADLRRTFAEKLRAYIIEAGTDYRAGYTAVDVARAAPVADSNIGSAPEPVTYVDCGECPAISTGCAGRCMKAPREEGSAA